MLQPASLFCRSVGWETPCVSVHSSAVGLHIILGFSACFWLWKLWSRTLRDQLHHQLVIPSLILCCFMPSCLFAQTICRHLCCLWLLWLLFLKYMQTNMWVITSLLVSLIQGGALLRQWMTESISSSSWYYASDFLHSPSSHRMWPSYWRWVPSFMTWAVSVV